MEYGTGFGYRENFISTKNITMWIVKPAASDAIPHSHMMMKRDELEFSKNFILSFTKKYSELWKKCKN